MVHVFQTGQMSLIGHVIIIWLVVAAALSFKLHTYICFVTEQILIISRYMSWFTAVYQSQHGLYKRHSIYVLYIYVQPVEAKHSGLTTPVQLMLRKLIQWNRGININHRIIAWSLKVIIFADTSKHWIWSLENAKKHCVFHYSPYMITDLVFFILKLHALLFCLKIKG